MPEISKDCYDMSNAASAYLGIVTGTIIGIGISWWIYIREKHASKKQDHILVRIKELEEKHGDILKKLEDFDDRFAALVNDKILNNKIDPFQKSGKESN